MKKKQRHGVCSFLKYCVRIVKSFPQGEHHLFDRDSAIEYLESLCRGRSLLNYGYLNVKKNNGRWPSTVNIAMPLERTETYYQLMDKYVIADQFQINNNRYFDHVNEDLNNVIFTPE